MNRFFFRRPVEVRSDREVPASCPLGCAAVPGTLKRQYLHDIKIFRGVAIVFIVVSHCITVCRWSITTPLDHFLETILRNGSVFFVFISGFLFHHIYCDNFNFRKFIITRIKNVLIPYVLLSLIPLALIIYTGDRQGHIPAFFYDSSWSTFFLFLATGCTLAPYWYIPMAALLYLLSPAIVALSKRPVFPKVIIVLLVVSAVIHRPPANLNPFHSALYFLPIYMLGILFSMHRQAYLAWLDKRLALLVAGVLFFAILQTTMFDNSGNFHKNMLDVTVIDVLLLQKLCFTGLIIVILNRLASWKFRLLGIAADYSFPIYFIHSLLLDLVARLGGFTFNGNLFTALLLSVVVMAVSVAIAFLAKRVMGNASRYLVGR